MPLISGQPIPLLSDDVAAKIPGWLFEHKEINYQATRLGPFIYRTPNIGECIRYHIALEYDIFNAAVEFLNVIKLTDIPVRLKPDEMGKLINGIMDECAIQSEDALLSSIDNLAAVYPSDILTALSSHLKSINDNRNILDMTKKELVDTLVYKQIVTKDPIRKKQNGRKA